MGGAKARIAIMPLCGIRCDCVAERDFLVDSIKESATTKISRYECRMSFFVIIYFTTKSLILAQDER